MLTKPLSTFSVATMALLVGTYLVTPAFAGELPDVEAKPIFNGKDLSGWKAPKDNIWWLVEDGILKVRSGPKKKGGILWTEGELLP